MLFENRRSDAGLPAPMRRTVFAAMLTVLLLIVGPEVALGPAKAAAVTEGGAAMIDTIVPTVVSISTRKAEPPRPKVADLAMTDKATAAIGAETEPVIGNYVGSGFVIDPSGVIVTNYHVVEQAFEIVVTFSDGTALPGTVMGASKLIDLAVLKVVADHPLPFARWGDSDRLKIGDTVFAAGNPFGVGLSVSAGIVSALNRDIQNSPFDDLIQTDASINHGNSGGPLFNKAGEVVGVDSVIISPTTGSSGIGFAIPSDSAEFVVDHLVRNGRVRPGWIGVKVQQIKSDLATALGLPRARGSVVAWVQPNGPADKAGLAVGDVIERFSNSSFDDERALLRTIARAAPGQVVHLFVRRDGEERAIDITTQDWPAAMLDQLDAPEAVLRPNLTIPEDLGWSLSDMPPGGTITTWGQESYTVQRGVMVSQVSKGSEPAMKKIAAGDVILRVGDRMANTKQDVLDAIERARSTGRPFLAMLIQRKEPEHPGPDWVAVRVISPQF